MSELIRISHVDQSVAAWKIAREIFRFNESGGLVEDVIPVGENEYDVQITDGTRAIVIGKLGQVNAIALAEQS